MAGALEDETHLHAPSLYRGGEKVPDQHPRPAGECAKVQDDRYLFMSELHALDEVQCFASPASGGLHQPGNAIDRDVAVPCGTSERSAIREKSSDCLSPDALDLASGEAPSVPLCL